MWFVNICFTHCELFWKVLSNVWSHFLLRALFPTGGGLLLSLYACVSVLADLIRPKFTSDWAEIIAQISFRSLTMLRRCVETKLFCLFWGIPLKSSQKPINCGTKAGYAPNKFSYTGEHIHWLFGWICNHYVQRVRGMFWWVERDQNRKPTHDFSTPVHAKCCFMYQHQPLLGRKFWPLNMTFR